MVMEKKHSYVLPMNGEIIKNNPLGFTTMVHRGELFVAHGKLEDDF